MYLRNLCEGVLVCNPEIVQVFPQRKKGGRRRASVERQFVNEVSGIDLRRKHLPGAGTAQAQQQRHPAFVAAGLNGLECVLHRAPGLHPGPALGVPMPLILVR